MLNPYKRLLQATGLSQRDFAAYAQMSGTALTYILTGQPPELSDWQVEQMARACAEKGVDAAGILRDEYGGMRLREAYAAWRTRDRVMNAEIFRQRADLRTDADESPFARYIDATTGSQQSFCKRLHVPASHVHRYASGKTATMPKEIMLALRDIGFGPRWMAELQSAQEEWRLEHAG